MSRRILILSSFVLAAAVLSLSVVRIGEGQVGVTAGGLIGAGWHLRLPLAPVARLDDPARARIDSLEARTPEGATRRVSVEILTPLAGASLDPGLAGDIARKGIAGGMAGPLSDRFTAFLRGADISRLGRFGSDTDDFGLALANALEERGMMVDELIWRRLDATPGPPVAPLLSPARAKLLVVGIDSADWQVATPLMAAGRLPNLEKLVRGGASAPLRSFDPMISPLIWTTMVTGVGPDAHGIADFTVMDPARDKRVPISSDYRRVKALWNIFSDAGVSSAFIGWWASHPAEVVRGTMVTELLGFSTMNGSSAGAGTTYPPEYFTAIRPRLVVPKDITWEEVTPFIGVTRAEFDAAVDRPPPDQPKPGAPPFATDPVWLVRKSLAATRNYATVAEDRLRAGEDVVAVYFEGTDILSHRFMHCAPPRMPLCPPGEFERDSGAVAAFYEYQDRVLGRLLDAAAGRVTMIVSDHGFRNGPDRPPGYLPYTTSQPVEWHREYGMLVLAGPGIRPGAEIARASVYDVAPTLLHLAGLPVGADMRGRVLTEAFEASGPFGRPPRTVASYEDLGTPLVAIASVSGADPEAEAEMIRNLQALGYVGGAPASIPAGTGASGAETPPARASREGSDTTSRVTFHRNLATYLLKQGKPDAAERELEKANRISKLPKTYELISQVRAARGDIDGAVAALEEALVEFPEMDEEAVLYIVELRLGQGMVTEAAAAFERWGSRVHRPAIRSLCEGRLAQARGEDDRAITLLLAALGAEPDLSQAAVAVAPLLAARGRLDELESPVRSALDQEARLDEYQNLLGVILLERGDMAGALGALDNALEINPVNGRYLDNFTAAALRAGAPDAAMDRLKRAVADPRADGATWASYARLLGAMKRPKESAAAFEKALAAGEASPSTFAGAVAATAQAGQGERAREILADGLRTHPDDRTLLELQRALEAKR